MTRDQLAAYLDEYLAVPRFDDASLNGVQVEGRPEVRRVAFAVSACAEVFDRAVGWGADAVVVHHGLLWKGDWPRPVRGVLRDRLATLLEADASLMAYHLPLDAHPEVGNNAVAARGLGLGGLEPFAEYHGSAIGVRGRFDAPRDTEIFLRDLEAYYGHPVFAVPAGPEQIRTVGLVSGGAAREVEAALALGLDAYVTGEPSEPVTYLCREAGITFAALGHYATERVGIRALMDHLTRRFGLEALWVEVDNPV